MAILHDVTAAAYHARTLGEATKSGLDQVSKTPHHYETWVRGELDAEADHFTMGTAFHAAVLEPELFAAFYAAEPDFGDCRKTDNRKRRDDWRIENAGKTLLSADMFEALTNMRLSVEQRALAKRLLEGGHPETVATWTDPETGITCKCRADYWNPGRALLVDIKSTLDAGPAAFRRDVARYGYHRQDAFYRAGFAANGAPVQHFVFVAVEKVPPFEVGFYTLHESAVAAGFAANRKALDTLAACVKANVWPGYPQEIITIELPRWAERTES